MTYNADGLQDMITATICDSWGDIQRGGVLPGGKDDSPYEDCLRAVGSAARFLLHLMNGDEKAFYRAGESYWISKERLTWALDCMKRYSDGA